MKINILHAPPENIFKNRRPLVLIFIALLAIACCGLFLGGYAIVTSTRYYEQFEKWALILFVAPTPFITYIGEKLQAYKKLTPPQRDELIVMSQHYSEVRVYRDLVAKSGRQPVRGEYEACLAWVEKVKKQV